MFQLETENKIKLIIDKDYKSWMRSEDVLVAIVFGTALYLSNNDLLSPILKEAKPINEEYKKFPVSNFQDEFERDAEIWPNFSKIKSHHPTLVRDEVPNNWELDGLWIFENDILIMEAKRAEALFDPEQLKKYINAFKDSINKRIWLLAVGKGIKPIKNLKTMNKIKNCNLFFIEWSTILWVIKQKANNSNRKVKRLLENIVTLLERRNLRPYDGFYWPKKEGISYLENYEKIQKKGKNWFHYIEP